MAKRRSWESTAVRQSPERNGSLSAGLLSRHNTLVRGELQQARGREAKTTGDGFLATLDGPARAIRCAIAIAESAGQVGST
jgi:class 3 adenylate cyclase